MPGWGGKSRGTMKTLHKYLAMDMLKTTAMSTAAFTLVMTVIGILEPLRKQGLAAGEVVSVLGLTFLLMLSLALPIATLFAATIVYGRFSQDNELTACRASGVSTTSVLKPALWAGGAVTLVTLLLSNFIVPDMAEGAGAAMYGNMKGVFFNMLNRRGSVENEGLTIRAEWADLSTNTLYGPVVIRNRSDKDLKIDPDTGERIPEPTPFMVAATAEVLDFKQTPEGDTYVQIVLYEARGELGEQLGMQESGVVELGPLRNPIEKSTSMFTPWSTLLASLKDPSQHPEIHEKLLEERRDIGNEMFAREVISTIGAGRAYHGLSGDGVRYEIRAVRAVMDGVSAVSLHGGIGPDGEQQLVEVREIHPDGGVTVRTAGYGAVETKWSPFRNASMVTIRLSDPFVQVVDSSSGDVVIRTEWVKGGGLTLPDHIRQALERIPLSDLLANPGSYTTDEDMIRRIIFLRDVRAPKLNNANIALMHFRVSYGASCFLMVAMGAALGLMFRGGQVLAAFALALIPAATVLIMAMMGKEMVRNPAVPTVNGLMCIWGGIAMILAANLIVYWRLSRK